MPNYETLSKLMCNAVAKDVLPDISFTDNNIQLLGTSVEHLAISNMNAQEFLATPKNVNTAISEYEYLTSNLVDHYNDLMPVKKVADSFAKKLNVGIKSLSNVKKAVTSLTAKVNEFANKRMLEDASIAVTLEHIEEPSINFSKINWDDLEYVNEHFVFNQLNSTVAVKPGEDPSINKIQILINRLPFGTPYNKVEFTKIDVNKELAKDTLDAVHKVVGTKVAIKDIKYVLSMLLQLDNYKCVAAINTFNEVLDDPSKINGIIQMARDFSIVLNAVTNSTLKFSASTKKELLVRKDILEKYADMATYLATYYRTVVWKDALVVPGSKLNPDVWHDFRRQGGSSIGIAQHLAHFYSEKNIPKNGISYKSILESRNHVLTIAKEEAATNISKIRNMKKEIYRSSFIYCATDWLNKNKDKWSRQFKHANNVDAFVSSIYDSTVEASIESSFYKVILNSCCTNTITYKLYTNLSDMYLKHVKLGGELTKAQCEALDLTVYANMITDFILKQKMIDFK